MNGAPERVVDHAHCEICGRVVRIGDRVCSPECQEKLDEVQRMKKRSMFMMIGIIVAAVLLSKLF